MLAWSGYGDRRQESNHRADALCPPQRCTNRRVNGQSSQHLFWPWRCMRALSCGLRCSRGNRRSKPTRLFSFIRWRKSSKRAPARPALPEQEPRRIDASAREGICRRNPAERHSKAVVRSKSRHSTIQETRQRSLSSSNLVLRAQYPSAIGISP